MRTLHHVGLLILVLALLLCFPSCAKNPAETNKTESVPTTEDEQEAQEEKEELPMDESLLMSKEEIKEAAKNMQPVVLEIYRSQTADKEIQHKKRFRKTIEGVVYEGELILVADKKNYNSATDKYELYYRGEMTAVE